MAQCIKGSSTFGEEDYVDADDIAVLTKTMSNFSRWLLRSTLISANGVCYNVIVGKSKMETIHVPKLKKERLMV